MILAAAVALCILMLIAGFVAPTLSRHPQRGVNRAIAFPRRLAAKLPGPVGRWAAKPFDSTGKYANKSAEKGRAARGHMPA